MDLTQPRRLDGLFILSCAVFLFLCVLAFIANQNEQHYYLDFQAINSESQKYFIFFMTTLYVAVLFFQNQSSQKIMFIKSLSMLFITLYVMEVGNTAIFTTPFTTHDQLMQQSDSAMGFHLVLILQYMHAHLYFNSVVWSVYYSLLLMLHVAPITLSITEKPETVYRYFFCFMLSVTIGYLIYYFFPTATSPAAVLPHRYFTSFQLFTLHAFHQEHLHQKIHFNMIGGIISFPSYHAIWCILIIYFFWKDSFFRYFALIYGTLVLIAILLTGWHYLTDVIGGILIAIFSIWLTQYLFQRLIDVDCSQ